MMLFGPVGGERMGHWGRIMGFWLQCRGMPSALSATRDIHGTLGPLWIVLYWSKMLNSRATSLGTNGNLYFYGTLRSDA